MRVRGPSDELASRLAQLPGVRGAKPVGQGGVEFRFESGSDVRADAARLAVNSGLDLLELRSANLSLEEIFLKLTTDAGESKEGI